MVFLLWKLRWKNLKTFDKLRPFGVSCLEACIFWDNEESLGHLFVNYKPGMELWKAFTNKIDGAF